MPPATLPFRHCEIHESGAPGADGKPQSGTSTLAKTGFQLGTVTLLAGVLIAAGSVLVLRRKES